MKNLGILYSIYVMNLISDKYYNKMGAGKAYSQEEVQEIAKFKLRYPG